MSPVAPSPRWLRRALIVLAVVAFAPIAPAAGAAEIEASAQRFIADLSNAAIQALTVKRQPRRERVARFRKLFNENFDAPFIGRWVLGRYWNTATEAERAEYAGLFEDMVVASYVDRFDQYAGEKLAVSHAIADQDGSAIVFSRIESPTGPPVRVDWRVAPRDGSFVIRDVLVEGTSMSATMRSDFASVIRQGGGRVAALIEELRKKPSSLKESGG